MSRCYTRPVILLAFLLLLLAYRSIAQQTAILAGKAPAPGKDSLKIVLHVNPTIRQTITYSVPIIDGQFKLEVPLKKPVTCHIPGGERGYNILLEPGDSIYLIHPESEDGLPILSGKGIEKAVFLMDFRKYNLYKKTRENIPRFKATTHPFDSLFAFIDSVSEVFRQRLRVIKPSMSKESFEFLRAEVLARTWGLKYLGTTELYHESIEETLAQRQNELTPHSKAILQNILSVDESLYYSAYYVNEVYGIFFIQYDGLVLDGKASKNLIDKYSYLQQRLPGRLKTPVLTLFLESDISMLNQAEDLERLFNVIYDSPEDSIYRNYIKNYYGSVTSFKKGMPAPDFVVENEKGEKVKLASFRGKVLYLDFWYAACGPCHALFSTLEPVKKHFLGRSEVVFLNISIDSKITWLNALKKYSIPGHHFFTEGKGADHPIIHSYKVGSYPTTCLIDRNGKIFLATPSRTPDELIQQIEKALID